MKSKSNVIDGTEIWEGRKELEFDAMEYFLRDFLSCLIQSTYIVGFFIVQF